MRLYFAETTFGREPVPARGDQRLFSCAGSMVSRFLLISIILSDSTFHGLADVRLFKDISPEPDAAVALAIPNRCRAGHG